MAEKKHSALALLDILEKYSDKEHILTGKEIRKHMEEEYGLQIERRTLYSNIDILEQGGFEISRYEDNGKGYYLKKRKFDKAEVLLLCNAVHASHFISQKQSDELIKKLLSTQSKYQRAEFFNKVYMPNPKKTANGELLRNIEIVSSAIRNRHELSFVYLRYDRNKRLVARRKERYTVEPRYIVYADSRAYMVVTSKNHEGYIHYRLDRMSRCEEGEEMVRPLPKEADAYEYAKNKLFMYTGEVKSVLLRCKDLILDQMIDLFGKDLILIPEEDSFLIRIKTSDTGARYLAQQYLDSIEILEPEELREEFIKELKETLKKYERA